MKFKCEKCGRNIDIQKADKVVNKICEKPLLYEVVATCKRCHHTQRVTVMDTLQKMYANCYEKLIKEMNNSGGFFRHPAYHAELTKKKLELQEDILHRHKVLMERIPKLREEGLLIDGK